MSIKDFAEKFIKAHREAYSTGNCDTLEKLVDSGVVFHSVTRGSDSIAGWEAWKQEIQQARQAISYSILEWQYLTGEGNHFALSQKSSGTVTAQAQRLPPGKEVTFNYLYLFRVDKGKISEVWYAGTTTVSG